VSDDVLQDELGRMSVPVLSVDAMVHRGPQEVPVGPGAMVHHDQRRFGRLYGISRDLNITAAQGLQQDLSTVLL
jgi:hypothetical protein